MPGLPAFPPHIAPIAPTDEFSQRVVKKRARERLPKTDGHLACYRTRIAERPESVRIECLRITGKKKDNL